MVLWILPVALAVRLRNHRARALSFWNVSHRHANWTMPRKHADITGRGQPSFPSLIAALVGRTDNSGVAGKRVDRANCV
jgi:hypothetical protein